MNAVLKRQLAIAIFCVSVVFKIAMLPMQISSAAQTQGYLTVIFMMGCDFLVFGMMYYLARQGGIRALDINPFIKKPLMLLLLTYFIFKAALYFSEIVNYVSLNIFDNGSWIMIMLILAAAAAFLSLRGIKPLMRVFELFIWLAVFTLIICIVLVNVDIDWTNVLPFAKDGAEPIFQAGSENAFWFGDLLPIMFLTVKSGSQSGEKSSKKGWVIAFSVFAAYLLTVIFYVIFYGIYGNLASFTSNAFSKLAIYNKLSEQLGRMDWFAVISWITGGLLSVSLIMFACAECVRETFEMPRTAAGLLPFTAVILIVLLGFRNIETAHQTAREGWNYFALAIEYAVAPLLCVWCFVAQRKKRKKEKTDTQHLCAVEQKEEENVQTA